MANPFGTENMAAGYAISRPPVHQLVVERIYRQWNRTEPFPLALDIGCGAGVSTKALSGFARSSVGLEPNESMLAWARKVAPAANFTAASAEALPFRDHSVDLITAAGSLNYVNLDLFLAEAARILTRDGVLVVYDFSPARSFRDKPGLEEWFSNFCSQYPQPANQARELSPAILAGASPKFHMQSHQEFEIGIPLTRDFYVNYMLTETNVAAAVARGVLQSEIASWCVDTLSSVWDHSEREVLFQGYFACMKVHHQQP
jgi:SAM-dependent methyltransferase